MRRPLAGLRVVDLTQVLAGPFCTMLLADLGADVVKVESPAGDVSRSWGPAVDDDPAASYGGYFASVNRNKRSVCLDLRDADDRQAFLALVRSSDVLVENFRLGTMEKFGLEYEVLREVAPRLVYASIRGFGDPRGGESPYAAYPSFDIIAQAMGGLLSVTGYDAEHPVKVGPGVGDIFPGALAAVGILAAVREAAATGRGRYVDVALYDAVLALTERIVYQYSITGVVPVPEGNRHPLLCPYGVVATSDGSVAVAAPSDRHWQLLADAMGRPDIGVDTRFATNAARLARADEVYALVEAWTRVRTTAEVVGSLGGRVPCGPVNTAADVFSDDHVASRHMIVEVEHPSGRQIKVAGSPIKIVGSGGEPFRRAPLLGEHTADVLAELGHPRAPRTS